MRAKPAARGQKAAAAKSEKAPVAVASAGATEPGDQDTVAAAGHSASPEDGPWQVPGYLDEQILGTDASGRVVRARHETTGDLVAITYLSAALGEDPSFREAFRAEAALLGGVDSPYVARFHGYVEEGARAAIVTELVDGIGLDAVLRENGATGPEPALAVLKGSLLGLAAAHEAGVVHRDLKPANVLVTTEGAVELVGFGLVRRDEDSGTPAGTPASTAPERWAGGPATAASDVYAATAAFYACLTGATPYAGSTAAELAAQHAEAPIPVDRAPEPVRPLLARGLAKDPAQRPQSAADFVTELEAVATAAYGADWEERGQRELAALVALLLPPSDEEAPGAVPQAQPALRLADLLHGAEVSSGAGAGGVGGGAKNGPSGGNGAGAPRFGRRAKILAITAAGVILAGVLAVSAVATGNKDETAAVDPSPTVATSLTSATTPAATTVSPTASPSPSQTVSPSASQTATSATPTSTATTTAAASATPTGSPATSPATAPTTPSAGPTKTTGSAAGPHVSSLAVTGFECTTGDRRKATATVYVQYDGTASGTLHLTWWRSATGKPQGAITMPPQTAHFPKGAQNFTFTDRLTFTTDPDHPYIGLTVSTDPAAVSGNGSYGVGCH